MLDSRDWKDYFNKLREAFGSDCHSLSRGFCYAVDNDLEDEIIAAYQKTSQAHLFHNAVPCANEIFNYLDRRRKKLSYLE
jgi:hypothetical protein